MLTYAAGEPLSTVDASLQLLYDDTAPHELRLQQFLTLLQQQPTTSVCHLLPLLLQHDSKPFTLERHFQFESLFQSEVPQSATYMTARQCGKTYSVCANAILCAVVNPGVKQLFITPLFEQARRLSSNYIRPLIFESPVRDLLVNTRTDQNVLQRNLSNGSMLQLTFSYKTPDRARGIRTDFCKFDEVQDSAADDHPIIMEAMSHSDYEVVQYTGTPKTPENVLTGLYQDSSMAEWFIPCLACKHWNVPSLEHDLAAMIGPWRADISPARPGLVCARCQRPVFPHLGHWEHRHAKLRWLRAGYHLSQPIMYIQYTRPDKLAQLLAKRDGMCSYTPEKYTNEVLGEPSGVGAQLVSEPELRAASTLPWENHPQEPAPELLNLLGQYQYRVLAVDWGGGGKKLSVSGEQISKTTLALLGWLPTGRIHVLWGCRLNTPHDHLLEAEQCLQFFRQFRCHFLAHDYTGAGSLRETFLTQVRVPLERIVPIAYVRAASSAIMSFVPPTELHPRRHYTVDKTRSLLLTCTVIRLGRLNFFKYDYRSKDDPGLIRDFLGLVEEKIPTRHASDIYTISRHDRLSDDFAQAVNIGCCTLWYHTRQWPEVTMRPGYELSEAQELAMNGGGQGWDVLRAEEL